LEKAVEEGARCDDERMWTLLGEMVNEGVVGVWTGVGGLWNMFISVATAGWQLLKVRRKHGERHLGDELYGSKIRMGGWCR
jgi:hypothetical protein